MLLIRLVVGPLQVNCFILADEKTKEAVVIDPGDDAGDILKVINEKGLKIKYILNTHAHFDHVGANKAIKDATGAELLLHEADAAALAKVSHQSRSFGMPPVSSPPADRYVKQGDTNNRRRGVPQSPAHARPHTGWHKLAGTRNGLYRRCSFCRVHRQDGLPGRRPHDASSVHQNEPHDAAGRYKGIFRSRSGLNDRRRAPGQSFPEQRIRV